MSRGNPEEKELDCFTSFAMTGSWSLRGEYNEPWQSTCRQICLVAGLLRFARNDGAELDCFAMLRNDA